MRSQTPAPVLRADLAGMRVCLVHANPWQTWRPVPPYGLHRLRTALEASGAVVSIVDPYLERPEDEAEGHLTARLRELAPDLVGFSLRVVDTLVPVETTDGDDGSSDSTPLLRASSICASTKRDSALQPMVAASTISPACTFTSGLSTVTLPSPATCSIRRLPAAATVADCSLP